MVIRDVGIVWNANWRPPVATAETVRCRDNTICMPPVWRRPLGLSVFCEWVTAIPSCHCDHPRSSAADCTPDCHHWALCMPLSATLLKNAGNACMPLRLLTTAAATITARHQRAFYCLSFIDSFNFVGYNDFIQHRSFYNVRFLYFCPRPPPFWFIYCASYWQKWPTYKKSSISLYVGH